MALVYKIHVQDGSDNTAQFPHNHLYISSCKLLLSAPRKSLPYYVFTRGVLLEIAVSEQPSEDSRALVSGQRAAISSHVRILANQIKVES